MKEKTATCQSQVTKWFGGSVSDTSQWDTLYQGFARICSSNNYKYNCRPTGCKISFTYGGTRYNDAEQTSIPANVRDAFIQQCQTSGCGYSATIAYVYSNRVNEREQNLCPIGFWLQKDYHDVNGLGSKATTIVHELSHFVDLAGSERVTKDKLKDESLIAEAKDINRSLLFLHEVIKSISLGHKPPTFRNTM